MALIYIVEDDINIREIERYALKNSGFEVEEFDNGKDFFQRVSEQAPSLMLLDIMLPGEDGLEILSRVRKNPATEKTPVIMVTAKTTEIDKVRGLDMGADDYISKPFHAKVLLMRCNNLIRNRLLLKSRLTKQVDFDVQLLATTSLDQQLLNRMVEIVDQRMGEPDFDVNALARELNMGRSSFFTKVKNLTGMTPSEFIQNRRINRAATLLQERSDLLVNEISDRLGFASTVYFSRCFKAKFGVSPAQFRKKEQ